MESFKIKNLGFTYPVRNIPAVSNVNLTINSGEFVVICGKSGSGKTTLLRLLKPILSPHGKIEGEIDFEGKPLFSLDEREQAARIGFVMQSPENQIATDKVWHELAFGLESLGVKTEEIRARVSEMATFFGIHNWFHRNVNELSGGQKQLLNLASVMVMQPTVLILDEPASQLDPIAAQEFLKTLEKINRELGVTVVMTEHRLEEVLPIADRAIVMDEGKIVADCYTKNTSGLLRSFKGGMEKALPVPMKIYGAVENGDNAPLTVGEGRRWLEEYSASNELKPELIFESDSNADNTQYAVEIKDVWFRYSKDSNDVIKGLNLKVAKGEIFALTGGNGMGKTTVVSLISGLEKPYRGDVLINGKSIKKIPDLYSGVLGVLPQNPRSVFVKSTVYLDLLDMLSETKLSDKEKAEKIESVACLCRIETLLNFHPFDLSGGEQQRAALAKVLLKNPEILLLDEPTKGMDAIFKVEFAEILEDLKISGITVIMVSHDIEFCAEYTDRCALLFDGRITSSGSPREFFAGKTFYTTSANRMARTVLPKAVLAEDIIAACTGRALKKEKPPGNFYTEKQEKAVDNPVKQKLSMSRLFSGIFCTLIFVVSILPFFTDFQIFDFVKSGGTVYFLLQAVSIIALTGAVFCFLPGREMSIEIVRLPKQDRKLSKRTLLAMIFILIAIPLTIRFGTKAFGGRRYYVISLLIILETMLPFAVVFESRKPKARELVLISVLCAIAVAGRTAFVMLPQFKPVVALVIIAGVCFGGETGFLVGAVTGFVSNFFFGQGPWTPWQMFSFGMIGFIAGILFQKGVLRRNKASLCVFGFLSTLVIFGGIMNPASVLMATDYPSWDMIKVSMIVGFPVDLIHALSTFCFLLFISEPMIEKLERVKVKYGLFDR